MSPQRQYPKTREKVAFCVPEDANALASALGRQWLNWVTKSDVFYRR